MAGLRMVLPVTATDEEDLIKTLNERGCCVSFKDALKNPNREKRIVVGKVIRSFEPNYEYKDTQVYHMESIFPQDCSSFRFVACGKSMVNFVANTFNVKVDDYLALYEPSVMKSAADLPTFYFPNEKCCVWVCKSLRKS